MMIFFNSKKIRLFIALFILGFLSKSYACGNYNESAMQGDLFAPMTKPPSEVPVWGVMSEVTRDINLGSQGSGCIWTAPTVHIPQQPHLSRNYTDPATGKSGGIFESGVPGLGWAAVMLTLNGRADYANGFNLSRAGGFDNFPTVDFRFSSVRMRIKFVLIKTSEELAPGSVFPRNLPLVQVYWGWLKQSWYVERTRTLTFGGHPGGDGVVPGNTTCEFTTANVSIPLTPISATDLKNASNFTIPSNSPINTVQTALKCPMAKKVYATISDTKKPASIEAFLENTVIGETAAQGVGLALEVDTGAGWSPVKMAPASKVVGAVNQFLIGNIGVNASVPIRFKASYMRTSGDVSPGLVKGKAELTLAYQ